MKTYIAELVSGDLQDNTMTFEIKEEMIIKAGVYAIVPIDEYKKLTPKLSNSQQEVLIDFLKWYKKELPIALLDSTEQTVKRYQYNLNS
ncbi:hypothetical protein [Bizionia myxarmorum]|uniref:Uncharacterized protein n=1 Tax=Bizionia myxarmorum TaxID=291186 RepID=A0A5D0RAE5_9FLAO|nr:hypothetical protein [Bizionia myxarmorum]TYB78323.1 hypothetical protein ES674_00655 [Bizionia myxarmorum]